MVCTFIAGSDYINSVVVVWWFSHNLAMANKFPASGPNMNHGDVRVLSHNWRAVMLHPGRLQYNPTKSRTCQDSFVSPCLVWHRLRRVPWCWPIGRQSVLTSIRMHVEKGRFIEQCRQQFPRWTSMTESTKEKMSAKIVSKLVVSYASFCSRDWQFPVPPPRRPMNLRRVVNVVLPDKSPDQDTARMYAALIA